MLQKEIREMEKLKEDIEKLNRRMDYYDNFLTGVINSIESDSDYTEAYVKAMKCALSTFNKLFERGCE